MPPSRFRVEGQGELAKLVKDLKALDPALKRVLARDLKKTAEPIAQAVREEAAAMGLHRAAEAVSVQFRATQRRASVQVAVNAKKAPYARPIDGGSQGRRNANRHRVFGRDVWVDQPLRPFFERALDRKMPEVGPAMEAAIDKAIREAGFK